MSKNSTKAKAPTPKPSRAPKKTEEVSVGRRSTNDMKAIGGSGFELWDTQLLYRTSQTAPQWPQKGEDPDDLNRRNAGIAGLALHAFAPKNPIEAMLASQAVALHLAAMECSRRAMIPQQSPDVASKLRKDAANSCRAMIEVCEALDRRRGKGGQQRIVVERVQVAPGGQAIVGTVTTGAPLPASPPTPLAIDQGARPMTMLDAESVEAWEGEA